MMRRGGNGEKEHMRKGGNDEETRKKVQSLHALHTTRNRKNLQTINEKNSYFYASMTFSMKK